MTMAHQKEKNRNSVYHATLASSSTPLHFYSTHLPTPPISSYSTYLLLYHPSHITHISIQSEWETGEGDVQLQDCTSNPPNHMYYYHALLQ